MSTAEQKRLWRIANPEKVKAENERRRLRKLERLQNGEAPAPVIKRKVVAAKPPSPPKPAKPVNANDPPELVELFRKASKGEPPRPIYPGHRKFSVFKLRGVAR